MRQRRVEESVDVDVLLYQGVGTFIVLPSKNMLVFVESMQLINILLLAMHSKRQVTIQEVKSDSIGVLESPVATWWCAITPQK